MNNFKDAGIDEIKASIVSSIHDGKEITLPGLGVFFELLWNGSDENSKSLFYQPSKKIYKKKPKLLFIINVLKSLKEFLQQYLLRKLTRKYWYILN